MARGRSRPPLSPRPARRSPAGIPPPPEPRSDGAKPGDDFNTRGTWEETGLFEAGWTWDKQTGDQTGFITRPGKDRDTSATLGICTSKKNGWPLLYNFTGNAPPLPSNESLSRFAVYTILKHGGDYSAAARELSARGYGDKKPGPKATFGRNGSSTGSNGATNGEAHGFPGNSQGSEGSDGRKVGSDTNKKQGSEGSDGRKVGSDPVRPKEVPQWVAFPTHLLPSALVEYVTETAAAMNCDEAYSALPTLTAIGAAIGTTHMVSPKKGWREPPVLWTVCIGLSGTTKSPPYRDVEDMAQDINDRLEKEFEEEDGQYDCRLSLWQERMDTGEDAGSKPKRPVLREFIKTDITIEALVGVLQDNPRGALIGRDELAGWIGGFTKYAGKTGASELQNWLQLSNAGTVDYTRKTGDRRRVRVRGVAVAVCGTTQPEIIASVLTAELKAAGLFARLLPAYPPERLRKWTEREVPDAVRERLANLMSALHQLTTGAWDDGRPRPHLVKLTPEAKAEFVGFYNSNGIDMADADGELRSAMSKLEGYALRFALIFHCCRYPASPSDEPIGIEDMAAAVLLAKWFIGESNRVYALLAEQPEDRNLRTLATQVKRKADKYEGSITVKQLQNSNSRKYKRSDLAEADLDTLVGAGFGSWEQKEPTGHGGHRVRFYHPSDLSDASDSSDPSDP